MPVIALSLCRVIAGFVVLLAALCLPYSAFAANHPLDPLSREEIAAAVEILKASGKISDASRFSTLVLNEPPKAEVLPYKPGDAFRREAFAVIYERAANKTFEAVVDLNKKAL